MLEILANNEHSSLFGTFVRYKLKSFMILAPEQHFSDKKLFSQFVNLFKAKVQFYKDFTRSF
jgi:hypothetical protein